MKRRKTLLFLILSLCLIAILTLSATASPLGNDVLNTILSEQPSDHIEQMGGSFFGLLVMIFIIYIINKIIKHEDKKYKESDYYKQTGIPYKVVKNDTGLYGE